MNVVIGNGWTSVAAVAKSILAHQAVTWVSGQHLSLYPILSSLENESAATEWLKLLHAFDILTGEIHAQSSLQEYRGKSLRSVSLGQILQSELWPVERSILNEKLFYFSNISLVEALQQLRAQCLKSNLVTFKNDIGLKKVDILDKSLKLTFGSGEMLSASKLIYADGWSDLSFIEGIPKPLRFLHNFEAYGALQVVFDHSNVLNNSFEDFLFHFSKEAHQKKERHLWGYFLKEKPTSVWTVYLTAEEIGAYPEVAKRLKKVKSLLGKIFEKESFLQTITNQMVRFESDAFLISSKKTAKEEQIMPKFYFLPDGFGISYCLRLLDAIWSENHLP